MNESKKPVAAKAIQMAGGHAEPARALMIAQSKYFPAWWTHIGASRASAPLYRVVCSSLDEIEYAQALKPDMVEAEYLLAETQWPA